MNDGVCDSPMLLVRTRSPWGSSKCAGSCGPIFRVMQLHHDSLFAVIIGCVAHVDPDHYALTQPVVPFSWAMGFMVLVRISAEARVNGTAEHCDALNYLAAHTETSP